MESLATTSAVMGEVQDPCGLIWGTVPQFGLTQQASFVEETDQWSLQNDEGSSMAKVRICLDPGHGGADPGAVRGDLTEASITLDLAHRARKLLVPKYSVILTRDEDETVALTRRVQIANEEDVDLFTSIHVNSAGSASSAGYEVFVRMNPHAPSLLLASALLVQFSKRWPEKPNRGVKPANFLVVRQRRPACLVECFFISNPSDRILLTSPTGRAKIAEAIAWGCGNFIRASEDTL
ncbi:MAG: N-acetylmuramoyl-L-alanine amidase family protein [bacterium]